MQHGEGESACAARSAREGEGEARAKRLRGRPNAGRGGWLSAEEGRGEVAERRGRRWWKWDGRNTRRESRDPHPAGSYNFNHQLGYTSCLHGGELYVKSTWTLGWKKDGRIHSFPRIFPGKDTRVLSSMSCAGFERWRNRWKVGFLWEY